MNQEWMRWFFAGMFSCAALGYAQTEQERPQWECAGDYTCKEGESEEEQHPCCHHKGDFFFGSRYYHSEEQMTNPTPAPDWPGKNTWLMDDLSR